MHEVSWRRVKWLRPSWSRKDLLTACGSVLVDTISIGASRFVSTASLLLSYLIVAPLIASPFDVALLGFALGLPWSRLQAFRKALGEPLGASRGPLGALLGTPWRPLGPLGRSGAAPGPSGSLPGPLLGASWADLGGAWAALGPILARS